MTAARQDLHIIFHLIHFTLATRTPGGQPKFRQLWVICCLALSHDERKHMGEILHQGALGSKILDDLPVLIPDAIVRSALPLAQRNFLDFDGQTWQIQGGVFSAPQHQLLKDAQSQSLHCCLAFPHKTKLTDWSGYFSCEDATVLSFAVPTIFAR